MIETSYMGEMPIVIITLNAPLGEEIKEGHFVNLVPEVVDDYGAATIGIARRNVSPTEPDRSFPVGVLGIFEMWSGGAIDPLRLIESGPNGRAVEGTSYAVGVSLSQTTGMNQRVTVLLK